MNSPAPEKPSSSKTPSGRNLRISFDRINQRRRLSVAFAAKALYVRSLARDLAEQLGNKAYISRLIRESVTPICLNNAGFLWTFSAKHRIKRPWKQRASLSRPYWTTSRSSYLTVREAMRVGTEITFCCPSRCEQLGKADYLRKRACWNWHFCPTMAKHCNCRWERVRNPAAACL